MSSSQMARESIRAVSDALLLILTGSLFLVDYAGGYSVGRTWPLLLIGIGLSKVLEYLVTRTRRPERHL